MNTYCLMKFIVGSLCFLQNTLVLPSLFVVAQKGITFYPASYIIYSATEQPTKDFECQLPIDNDIVIILDCSASFACTLGSYGSEPLVKEHFFPALSLLTDNCLHVTVPFSNREESTTVVSQSQIKVLRLMTARQLSFYSGYFCNLHNVTAITFPMSLNNPRTLGFNDDCSAIDSCLHSLRELVLIFNNVTVIQKNHFCGIPNLKILHLKLNKIFSIEQDAFRTLNHLESFRCAENNLTYLPKDLFVPFQSSLKYLDLSGNSLGSDVFIALRHLSQLETLWIHRNKIAVLYGDSLKGLTSLKSLTLGGNGITALNGVLLFSTALEVVDLAYNRISHISESSFSTLLNLTNLDLDNNQLTSVPSQIFKSNTNLTELNLSNNKLTSIPELKYVPNLRVFKMTGNQLNNITLIDKYSLCSAANVNMLDLSRNNISYIIPGAFSCHSNLTSVNLSMNKLKTISAMKSSSITTLYVDGNKISEFSFHDISTSLLYLYMRRNKIREFSYDCVFPNISAKMETPISLRHLDLTENSVNFLYVSDNENTSACLFGKNSPPTMLLSTVGNACQLMLKFKKNSTFPIEIFRIIYVYLCEFDFWKRFKTKMFFNSCDPPLTEVFKNLNLLDKFTCAVDSRKTKEPHCQNNLYPEYYHQCGLHCPDGCQCFIGNQYDFHLINCSNLNLTFIPSILHMLESTILNLSGNHLTSLNGSMLYSYVNATELFLCHNRLLDIDDTSFFHFHLLEVLHLEYNQLTVLKNGLFKDLKHLKTLNVSHNALIQIEDQTFQPLGHLLTLALHENQLANMAISILEDLTSSLVSQGLSLWDNPWNCDCDFVVSFKEWLLDSLRLVKDPDHLVCVQDNGSAIPVLTFNSTICTSPTVVLLQNLTLLISIISVTTFVTIVAILIYLYRKEMQILVYSRYGIRFFQRNSDFDRDKRYDAFLAYSSLDGLFVVEQLLPGLEQIDKPYRICVHQRDFLVGAIIMDSILEAVEVSARTIVILSENFVSSGFCRFEFKSAHLKMLNDRCARLIVIVLGDIPTDLDPEMKLYLKTNTYLEWGDPLFWEKLYFALPDRR